MLTMTPEPDSAIRRAASRDPLKTPRVLTAKTCSHASSAVSSTGMLGKTPALFTQMSRPPRSATTPSVAARTDAASVTSMRTPTTRPPTRSAISDAARTASASSMSATATEAPASASREAIAFPSPRPPPVTSARRPASDRRSPTGAVERSAKGKLTPAPPPGGRCAGRPGRARQGSAWGCARTSRGRWR